MIEFTPPFPIENLSASIVEALKIKGDARSIALIIEGELKLIAWGSDFGVTQWRLFITTSLQIYHAISDDEMILARKSIADATSPFFIGSNDELESVVIAPQVTAAKDGWRDDAIKFIKGDGVTNQGRVRSDNVASKQHQGLLFRSKAEITLLEALIRAKLAVAPLPVFVRVGKQYNRLEPDFIVIHKGLTFVVEVDGDTYHKELPAEADKRLKPLTYEGVEVHRIRAIDLPDSSHADTAVKQLIEFMDTRKAAR